VPIRIDYDAKLQLLSATVTGDFSFEETQQAISDLMDHPSLDFAETRVLWDMSEAALAGLTPDEIQGLVGSGDVGMARILLHRRAVVVKHDLHFGIAREYDAYQTPTEETVNVFRSRQAALRFLGVPGNAQTGG
jgi:hypothetical protein